MATCTLASLGEGLDLTLTFEASEPEPMLKPRMGPAFDGSYFEYYPAPGVEFIPPRDLLAYTEFDYRRVAPGQAYVAHFNLADIYTFDEGPDRLHLRYSAFHPGLDIATMRESSSGSFYMSNWITLNL